MTSSELDQRYSHARKIAKQAAELVHGYFQTGVEVQSKSDASPVTIADRTAEELLRREIEAAFPDDGIVGEEYGQKVGSTSYRWILDPIDGTRSFISDVPLFGTMVAVERDGRGVIGVVTFPALGSTIDAMVGGGAWETAPGGMRRAARVNDLPTLGDGLVLTTDWRGFEQRDAIPQLNSVARAASFMRTWGDCYGHYLVATGRAVAMIDPRLNIWDAAALQPIMEEAGGTFTDWEGHNSIDSGDGISTNGKVLSELLGRLRRAQ